VGVQNFQVLLIDDSINANNKQTKNKKQNKKKTQTNKKEEKRKNKTKGFQMRSMLLQLDFGTQIFFINFF
jgi:sorbitol-specific phosphotransferase system component IIBC